jgi:hypothetical protein
MKRALLVIVGLCAACKGPEQRAFVVAADPVVKEKASPDAAALGAPPARGATVVVRALPFYGNDAFFALEHGFIARAAVVLLPLSGKTSFVLTDDTTLATFPGGAVLRKLQMGAQLETLEVDWAGSDLLAVIEKGEVVATVEKARVGSAPPSAASFLQTVVAALKAGDARQTSEAVARAVSAAPTEPAIAGLAARLASNAADKSAPLEGLSAFWTVPSQAGVAYVARPDLVANESLTLAQPVLITTLKGDKAEISFGVSGTIDLGFADGAVRQRHLVVKRVIVARQALSTEPLSNALLEGFAASASPEGKTFALALLFALAPSAESRRALVDAALASKSYPLLIDALAWEDPERWPVEREEEFASPQPNQFDAAPYLLLGCRGKRDKVELSRCAPPEACTLGASACAEVATSEICIPELVSTRQDVCTDADCRERIQDARRRFATSVKEVKEARRLQLSGLARLKKSLTGPQYFRFSARRLLNAPRLEAPEEDPVADGADAAAVDQNDAGPDAEERAGGPTDGGATLPAGVRLYLYRLPTEERGSGECTASIFRAVDRPEIRVVNLAPTELGLEVVFWVEITQYESSEYGAALAPSEAALRRWLASRKAEEAESRNEGPPESLQASFPMTRSLAFPVSDCSAACE